MRTVAATIALVLMSLTIPPPAAAGPALCLGLGAGGAHPAGAFADRVGTNPWVDVRATWLRDAGSRWGLSGHYSGESYDALKGAYALPGIDVDLTTASSLQAVTLGTLVRLGERDAQLWLHAGAGVAILSTETYVDAAFASVRETNASDVAAAFEGGVTAAWRVRDAFPALFVESGANALAAAGVRYVPRGGARIEHGALQLSMVESDVFVVGWRLGLTVAL